jgi:hypothetical protein
MKRASTPWPLTFDLKPSITQHITYKDGRVSVSEAAVGGGLVYDVQVDRSHAHLDDVLDLSSRAGDDGRVDIRPANWQEMLGIGDNEYKVHEYGKSIPGYWASNWTGRKVPFTFDIAAATSRGTPKALSIGSGAGGVVFVPDALPVDILIGIFQDALPPPETYQGGGMKQLVFTDRRVSVRGQGQANWVVLLDGHEVHLGHLSMVRLLAFAIASVKGQEGIDVTDPMIGTGSIAPIFGTITPGSASKPRDLIHKAFRQASLLAADEDLVRSCRRLNKKYFYEINADLVSVDLVKLRSSHDPEVQSLLSAL